MPKRSRSGSVKTNEKDYGEGGQELRTNLRSGRKVKKSSIAKVLDKRDVPCGVTFFKVLPAVYSGASPGLNQIGIDNSTAGKLLLPVYLFNTMYIPGAANPLVGMRLQLDTATSALSWSTISGLTANAGNSNDVQWLYKSPDYPADNQPVVHFARTNIKLMLYGAKARTTRFNVQLVEFEDDDISPYDDLGLSRAGLSTTHQTYWMNKVRPLLTHPCDITAAGTTKFAGRMKVLKGEQFLLEPTQTNETNTNPHSRSVNWSHGINRTCNMRQGYTGATGGFNATNVTDARVNVTDAAQGIGPVGLIQVAPKIKDRVFLMVSAENFQTPSGWSTNIAGSFDFAITTSHYVNS